MYSSAALATTCSGQVAGDVAIDFASNGAAAGDTLRFSGFGAGATLSRVDATDGCSISYGGQSELLRILGVTSLASDDYLFT